MILESYKDSMSEYRFYHNLPEVFSSAIESMLHTSLLMIDAGRGNINIQRLFDGVDLTLHTDCSIELLNEFLDVLQSIEDQDGRSTPFLPDLEHWRHVMQLFSTAGARESMIKGRGEEATKYILQMGEKLTRRRVVRSSKGLLGITSLSTEVGDEIWLLSGGLTPYVLRRLKNGNYRFLGEAYAYGIMYGEGLDWAEASHEIVIE